MDGQRRSELARRMSDLANSFWAGEAEICRAFWAVPRTSEEQAHWLRLQVFKEMYGSGLHTNPEGIIRGILDDLRADVERIETRADREAYDRDLRVLREEFAHFRLYADILEGITGEPINLAGLRSWQLAQDRRLGEVRQGARERDKRLGALAVGFTEGGGSAFFYVGRDIGGDPVSEEIARACRVVFEDELEHGEHGAHELDEALETEEEWAQVREMVVAICQQRLRMRYEMFGFPVDEGRIAEIAEGKIEPLLMTAS
ncbi:MAG: hypothetical protein IIC31_08700 [Chloroflexi bacterium]|nr:hypothetical protein [Chloroflexota bacterium]